MNTSDLRKATLFLKTVGFYGSFLFITVTFAYLCYISYGLYTLRGDFKDIAAVIFVIVFYLFVSAKILPYRSTPAKNDMLWSLYLFLISGYSAVNSSNELVYAVIFWVALCASGCWLSSELRASAERVS